MGIVYEAEQLDQGDAVAIKVLQQHLAPDPAVRARFRREAHATVGLSNPHLVAVKDFQSPPDDLPYLVMELLHGQTLQLLLKHEGPMSVERAARLAVQGLSALRVAHEAGVVHRDIKPDNLFVMPMEMGDTLKLLDFGVARLLHEDDTALGTEAGAWVGTPSFMAPEQVRCKPADARTDIYAMGACLYQMVTGRLPIEVQDTVALLSAIIERVPTPVTTYRPEIPEAFSKVVDRALHKDPARRFASAAEMAEALAPWIARQTLPVVALDTEAASAPQAPATSATTSEEVAAASESVPSTGASLALDAPRPSLPEATAAGPAPVAASPLEPRITAWSMDDDEATVNGRLHRSHAHGTAGGVPEPRDAQGPTPPSPSLNAASDTAPSEEVSTRRDAPLPISEEAPALAASDASLSASMEATSTPVARTEPEGLAMAVVANEAPDANTSARSTSIPLPSPIHIGSASDDDDATVIGVAGLAPATSGAILVGSSSDDGDDATVIGRPAGHVLASSVGNALTTADTHDRGPSLAPSGNTSLEDANAKPKHQAGADSPVLVGSASDDDDDATAIGVPEGMARDSSPVLVGSASDDDDDDATAIGAPASQARAPSPSPIGSSSDDDDDDATVIELSPEPAQRAARTSGSVATREPAQRARPRTATTRQPPNAEATRGRATESSTIPSEAPRPRRATLTRNLLLGATLLGIVAGGLLLWL
ncbi:protein kinase [Myxococcus stipitatus]|nr:protein kinase [Myxococcus stipitatus]